MVLKLGRGLTLANAGEVKQALLNGLQNTEALSLDAGDLTDVDVAGLQVLCATHRLAVAQGKTVAFVKGPLPGLAAAAARAGFGPGRGCAPACLCAGGRS
jgi:anti-anti-sigma regulatory factor